VEFVELVMCPNFALLAGIAVPAFASSPVYRALILFFGGKLKLPPDVGSMFEEE